MHGFTLLIADEIERLVDELGRSLPSFLSVFFAQLEAWKDDLHEDLHTILQEEIAVRVDCAHEALVLRIRALLACKYSKAP